MKLTVTPLFVSDNSEWRDVAKTCSDVDRLTYNEGDSLLSVEVFQSL